MYNIPYVIGSFYTSLWHMFQMFLYIVGQKTVPMFGCFAKIELEQIEKIR